MVTSFVTTPSEIQSLKFPWYGNSYDAAMAQSQGTYNTMAEFDGLYALPTEPT